MRKKLRIVTAILLIAIFGGIVWQVLRGHEYEPIYQGRALSFWLRGYGIFSATNEPTRHQADAALDACGTNAVPVLLRMLHTPDTPLEDKFLAWVGKQRFAKINPPMPSWMRHQAAFWGLLSLGPRASNAVPELMEMYDRQPSILWRPSITSIYGSIGPAAKAAIPQLLSGTADTNANVRVGSIFALGRIHAQPELVVPVLINCLYDPSPDIQGTAVNSLRAYGKQAKAAVPALIGLLNYEEAKSPKEQARDGSPVFGWTSGTSGLQPYIRGMVRVDLSRTVAEALKAIDPKSIAPKWQDGVSDKTPLNFQEGFR